MPLLSAIAVRLALVHLVLGSLSGAIALAARGLPVVLPWPGLVAAALAAHPVAMLAGWLLQLALGVAFWILPRFLDGPPRGREEPAWVAVAAINAGTILAYAGPLPLANGLVAIGAAAFAIHALPRIRALKRVC